MVIIIYIIIQALTIPLDIKELKREVRRFIALVRAGNDDAFYDPQFSPVVICLALTASWHSIRRWHQLARTIPEGALREELAAFWSEIKYGADVDSCGATLNARLGRKVGP